MGVKPKTLDFVIEEGNFSSREEINYIGILGRKQCSMRFPRELPFAMVRKILRQKIGMVFA